MTHLTARFDAIDSAKGIGIILVVFGHAWRGAFGAGLIPNTVLFGAIDAGIYAFHMPLFFFLSGLLFLETLRKYDMGKLLKGRVTRLLCSGPWPCGHGSLSGSSFWVGPPLILRLPAAICRSYRFPHMNTFGFFGHSSCARHFSSSSMPSHHAAFQISCWASSQAG